MQNSSYVYPMYSNKDDKTRFCKMHNGNIRNLICTELLCPQSGLICKECVKLSIHKIHASKIVPIRRALQFIIQSLSDDNFDTHFKSIKSIQESFSSSITFFKENNVSKLLSLEKVLIELKENFWNSLLITNSRNVLTGAKDLEQQDDSNLIIGLQALLDRCSLPISRLFSTDLKWYFDSAIQIIIDEFRKAISPYYCLVEELQKEKNTSPQAFENALLKRLTKLWTVKNSIIMSHGITNRKSYQYLFVDLKDNTHIAYFDWKFIYIYNYRIEKVKFTIKTGDTINGIAFMPDKRALVSFHYGSFLRTFGINVWDLETGANLLEAENLKNVYNLVYLKKANCFAYDSDDLYGNYYQIGIFDLQKKKTTRVLYIPELNIQDELIFKYDEKRNTLTIKITPDSNIPRDSYDCLFVTYDCHYFNKIKSMPIKVDEYFQAQVGQKTFDINPSSMLVSQEDVIMSYTPSAKYPLRTRRVIFNQDILEFGSIINCQEEKNILLISCRRNIKLHNIHSILIYDIEKNKIIGETPNISGALVLKLMLLEKEDLILAATYDSKISFLRKTLYKE